MIAAILNQKYDPHFPLQHQQKDLRLALQLGDKVEQPLYIAAAANEVTICYTFILGLEDCSPFIDKNLYLV